jgi:hypothetical protein
MRFFITFLFSVLVLYITIALAQQPTPPTGAAVLNQGLASQVWAPSDTGVINPPARAIYNGNGTGCNIAMALTNDKPASPSAAAVWQNIQPGEIIPVSVKAIYATNTTCTNIVVIW